MLELRKTTQQDPETLFIFQTNPEGTQMTAFTSENPSDKSAYLKKWSARIERTDVFMQTTRVEERIVGSVVHFNMMGETNVSYWIDREFWGKGIATEALQKFIQKTDSSPLFARVAFDNIGSQRVLEKCGFERVGTETGFANGRRQEIREFVYRLTQ